ncbi:MAG TPA: dipeptide/oligopeptide/nickel ABC transporter ATP-binding protein [Candidatus Angelobacter sp.]|nr:dipeptide/oligopeptide/nickel ABC transporter ATP-binding protein [Candidatus Angelobacter sp.]
MRPEAPPSRDEHVLLRAAGLTKTYRQGPWFSRTGSKIEALKRIDLTIRPCSTLGIIGRSGSGKSTLARCLASIEQPDAGEIWFEGRDIARPDRHLRALQRQIQIIFQEPGASLNPRLPAVEIVSEPLRIAGQPKGQRRERAAELMRLVGLPPDSGSRLPPEFSSGQRRRLAIARALTLRPKVLILDESLTGLDLSVQAQISNLLLELQTAYSLTYICISHDLSLVAHLADEIAVMDQGQIVENAPVAEFLAGQGGLRRGLCAALDKLHSLGAGSL